MQEAEGLGGEGNTAAVLRTCREMGGKRWLAEEGRDWSRAACGVFFWEADVAGISGDT